MLNTTSFALFQLWVHAVSLLDTPCQVGTLIPHSQAFLELDHSLRNEFDGHG